MDRESRLNHLSSRSASLCSKRWLLLLKVRRLFPRAHGQKLRKKLRRKRHLICGRAGDEGTSSQTPLENVETVLDVFREALCECSAGVLRRGPGKVASELTLASEPSSQTLWSAGKPILDFIFESGMNRIGHELLKPAGFSCKFRSLRDEDPGPFGLLLAPAKRLSDFAFLQLRGKLCTQRAGCTQEDTDLAPANHQEPR